MSNPFQSSINEFNETAKKIIFIIIIIFVLGTLGVAFGMQEFTDKIISSISIGTILILAIPPIGLIIGIIFWIKKKTKDVVNI